MADLVFRFEGFELDAANFQLRHSGLPVQLQKIPLQLLLLLVERNGQLVSRDEIVERVWGKDVFLDVDSAVSTAIRKVRQALRDDPAEPRYIETVPTKGYRFRLPHLPPAKGKDSISTRPIIAVLPLDDLSEDSQDYFSEGLTEEILTHLGRLPHLGVIARTSVMGFKGTRKPMREIGHELGAGYVLEGSVRRHAGKVRIAVQLIETESQTHLWAESYERELDDIFRLQDRLARDIACWISLQLKVEPPAPSYSTSVGREAYDAYLKGRYFWNKRTAPEAIKSIDHFQEAIRLEPSFAPAHAGLADAYIFQAIQGIRSPAEAYPKAEEAALAALSHDNSLADALCSMACIQNFYHWKWTTAERLFRRAIELNQSYSVARFFYAGVLSEVGCFDEAFRQIAIARETDPLSAITLAFSGYISYRARQYQRAAEQIDDAIEMDSRLPTFHWFRGLVLEQQGNLESAIQAHGDAVRLSMGQPMFVAAQGHVCGRTGREREALGAIENLLQLSTLRYVSPLEIAVIYIGLDNTNAAFDWLQKAHDQRVTRMRALRDPIFDRLRFDLRYIDLASRVGLPVEG